MDNTSQTATGMSLEDKRSFMQQQRDDFTIEQKRAFMQQQREQHQQQAQVPAQSEQSEQPALEATVEGDKGVMDYVTDVAYGVSAGFNNAVNETLDLSWSVGNFAKEAWEKGVPNAEFREPTKEEKANMFQLPVYKEAETLPGKLAEGVSQFATGFIASGTAMKAAKVLQGASTASKIAQPMVQGAIADFASFDAHEERLSNLVEQYPALSGPVTAYLAADPADSAAEGRFKNMLEGLGLGVATDSLVQGVKALKMLRSGKSAEEAAKVLEQAQVAKIEEGAKSAEGRSTSAEAPPESVGVKQTESGALPGKTEPRTDLLSPDAMKSIIKKAKTADEAITEITFNSNLNKMTFNSPQGSHIIKDMGDALAAKTLKGAGKEAHTKILADTTAELKEFGIDYTQALAEAGSDPKAVNALTRRMLANRNVLHMMTTEASRLADKIGMGTESLVERAQFAMLTKNIQEMHLNVADMRTELGRALSALNIHVDDAGAKGLKGHDLRAFVDDSMKKAFDENGAVVRGELTADSLLTAQRATWTQDLGNGTWGGDIQKFTNKHFFTKIILPFIRTPTNLFRDFLAHTPGLQRLSVDYRQMMSKGGEEAARAQGQLAMGSLTIITGIGLAMEGHITGSPPKNPKVRKALEATGWEPYSIKIGDKYYSYRRYDPVGMFLGTCADWTAIFTGKDDLSELTQNEINSTLFAMVMNNITSKTYMQGLSEVVNVINDGDRYFTSFAGRMASTFVPASSMLRTVRKEKDPHMREMEDITDYALNTVPGFSETLPAKYNWVTGKMVDYRPWVGHDNNNLVLDELNRLGRSVIGAPLKTIGGVRLNSKQYSKLNELHGTLKIGGVMMEERLHKLFTSPKYDLERNTRLDAPDGLPGPRSTAVEKIINAYRDAAQAQLLTDFPELKAAVNEKEAAQWAAKRGKMNKNNKTEVLDKLLNR